MGESAPYDPRDYLEVRRLGRTCYEDVHALQQELVGKRIEGEVGDLLLVTEHEPVVTVGRGGGGPGDEDLQLPVLQVERGGEATWHGPGQVVAYPLLLLPEGRRDLHRYLRDLEEVVIRVLAEVGVLGERRDGLTGVWIGARKVCSIGVAVRRWVSWHGLALNVHSESSAFADIRPCGLDPEAMTCVAEHAELPPSLLLFEVLLVKHLCAVFGLELPPTPPLQSPEEGAAGCGMTQLPILPD